MATPEPRDRAFERLYERYVKDVYRYALAVLRNPADAEDVTQTTFMNAYRAMQRGEEPIKPQHWLITIAHNACRTRAIRASRRPKEVPLDVTVHELAVPEQERPNVEAVLKALGRLPFNQRAALVMRELEGRSYEEIAETLGVTVPAVETLLFRARRSLRVRREALLRGLAGVPLPASLHTFVGGTAATTGGVALGSGALLKVAAVVTALVAGTAGYEAATGGVVGKHDEHPVMSRAEAVPLELALTRLLGRPAVAASVPPGAPGSDPAAVGLPQSPVGKWRIALQTGGLVAVTRDAHVPATHVRSDAAAAGPEPGSDGAAASGASAAPQPVQTTVQTTVQTAVETVRRLHPLRDIRRKHPIKTVVRSVPALPKVTVPAVPDAPPTPTVTAPAPLPSTPTVTVELPPVPTVPSAPSLPTTTSVSLPPPPPIP